MSNFFVVSSVLFLKQWQCGWHCQSFSSFPSTSPHGILSYWFPSTIFHQLIEPKMHATELCANWRIFWYLLGTTLNLFCYRMWRVALWLLKLRAGCRNVEDEAGAGYSYAGWALGCSENIWHFCGPRGASFSTCAMGKSNGIELLHTGLYPRRILWRWFHLNQRGAGAGIAGNCTKVHPQAESP